MNMKQKDLALQSAKFRRVAYCDISCRIKTDDTFVLGHAKFKDTHQLYEQKYAFYNHIISICPLTSTFLSTTLYRDDFILR